MDTVHKLEATVAKWYRDVPHLPAGFQKWLAENIWWLVIICAVLGVFGVLGIVLAFLVVGFTASTAAVYGGAVGTVGAILGGIASLMVLVALAFYVVELVIMIMAVSPLKERRKKGWDLLFLLALLNVLCTIIVDVLTVNLTGLVFGILWSAVGAYFLFEIRSYFVPVKPIAKKTTVKKEG